MESRSTIAYANPEIRSRTDIINQLIRLYGYTTYLEIGVRKKSDNFDKVNCLYKVAVDPNHDCEYRMTSDQFFTLYDRKREFDLVLVDGLHTREQALRDIMNALANLSANGAIVVHDCNPGSEYLARPYAQYKMRGGAWNGSVWKAIATLRMERADLEIFTFDIDHGTAVIRRGKQALFVPSDPDFRLDYAFLDAHRKALLNLVHPNQFTELMGSRGVAQNPPQETRIDVVYALGSDGEDDELRYSLRSVEKYLEELGHVWFIGEKPDWLQGILHIPHQRSYEQNQEADLINALIRVCLEPELSTEFLFMGHQQCLLSLAGKEDLKPYYQWNLHDTIEWQASRRQQQLKRTFEKLRSENKAAYHFDSRIPHLFDKRSFPEIMLKYDYGADDGYAMNTLYQNNRQKEVRLHPSLQVNQVRAALCGNLDNEQEIRDVIKGKRFLTYNKRNFTPSLRKVLDGLFPHLSKFEIM